MPHFTERKIISIWFFNTFNNVKLLKKIALPYFRKRLLFVCTGFVSYALFISLLIFKLFCRMAVWGRGGASTVRNIFIMYFPLPPVHNKYMGGGGGDFFIYFSYYKYNKYITHSLLAHPGSIFEIRIRIQPIKWIWSGSIFKIRIRIQLFTWIDPDPYSKYGSGYRYAKELIRFRIPNKKPYTAAQQQLTEESYDFFSRTWNLFL